VETQNVSKGLQVPNDTKNLAQSANLGSNGAIPTPGNAPARSVVDLTVAKPEEDLAQLAVDAVPQVPSIDNAM